MIYNQLWWRASKMVEDFENSRQGMSPLGRGILRRKIIDTQSTSMESSATLTCCTGLYTPRISSVFTEQSQEASQSRPESARRTHREIQIKKEELKSLAVFPRLPQTSGNRMLQNLKDFNLMPLMSKIEYLRTTANFYYPVEKGNNNVTTTLDDDGWWKRTSMCKEYTTPRNREDSKPYAPLELLQSYWCSWYWSASTITEFTMILRMGFDKSWSRKMCERNSTSQLWHRTRFEQCQNEGWTFKHASGKCCLHDAGHPDLLEKQQRPQRRQQQSYVNTSENKDPSRKERDHQGGQIWTSIRRCQKYTGHSWETCISKCVTNTVRQNDQDEREADGVMHRSVILPVLRGRFQNQLEKEFTDEDWLHCFYLGSIETRFAICEDESGELKCIRAIQGHSGGMIISPRLMNYVMIPYKWKPFIHHVGRARDQYSLAEAGLVAGGKNEKGGRQTIFFTPHDPFNSDADEAESMTDVKKPRKVHYQIHWTPEQDAVYWIHLSTAQDAGLEFWQTGSNAIITYQSVPKESVVKVVSESGKRQ